MPKRIITIEVNENPFLEAKRYIAMWISHHRDDRGDNLISDLELFLGREKNKETPIEDVGELEDYESFEKLAEYFAENGFKSDAEHIKGLVLKMKKWLEADKKVCQLQVEVE